MDDSNLSDRKRAKQLELAADMLRSNSKALSDLHHPSDNDIRKAIENSVDPLYNARTAAAAYGGAMVGGPIGAAIAGAVRADTVQADVANKMVMGREILDKYMADPKYYSESIWAVPTIDFKYINEHRDLMETLSKTEKNAIIHSSDVLCHYGRMGQKWGIRRYQNLDGSLTEAGRLRYSKTRDRYGMDIEDRSKLTKRQQKMQSDAEVAYMTLRTVHPELKTDNDIRKYAENQYKSVAAIERGRTALTTVLAAVGGTVLSGGNPIGGAASAGATFVVNTARQELTRGRRTADYANTIALGKEVHDKFLKDARIYLVTLPEGAGNNDTIKAIDKIKER